jgi:hypothetical protein
MPTSSGRSAQRGGARGKAGTPSANAAKKSPRPARAAGKKQQNAGPLVSGATNKGPVPGRNTRAPAKATVRGQKGTRAGQTTKRGSATGRGTAAGTAARSGSVKGQARKR